MTMALSFNDTHVANLINPNLVPNERVLYKARGVEKPWYSQLLSRFGSMFWRQYLVAATDQRILFVQYGGLLSGFASKKVDALSWGEIDRTQLGWGVFNKNLTVRSDARRFKKTVVVGRFWMKDNFPSAEGMVKTWTQSRAALPSGGAIAALPRARA
jgi:hypothetical protein